MNVNHKGLHSALVCTVASQHEGPGYKSELRPFLVESALEHGVWILWFPPKLMCMYLDTHVMHLSLDLCVRLIEA